MAKIFSKSYLPYINSFRAVAIIFIVCIHTMYLFNWEQSRELEKLIDIVIGNGTVMFLMIAGYLFQHLSDQYNTKKYLLTKLKHVIVPYLIISIPAIIFFVFIQHKELHKVSVGFYDLPKWEQIIRFYLTGDHLSPMWFIPVIILFYLSAPILVKADKTKLFYCFLPVFFYISTQFSRGLIINSYLHMFSAYMFGMFCSRYKTVINPIITSHWGVIGLILIYLGFVITEYDYYSYSIHYLSLFQKLTLSLIIISFFIQHERISDLKLIKLLAHTSFGIYFLHAYVLFAFKIAIPHLNDGLITANLFALLFFTAVVIGLSMLLVLLIERIFNKTSLFIVGSRSFVDLRRI